MPRSESQELSSGESQALARKIRELLASRRMSRQRLADDAKLSISTLEKALAGKRPFTLATIVRLEDALGVSLRARKEEPKLRVAGQAAPAELGGYAREGVRWLEGTYLTLRGSFEISEAIFAYRTKIAWSETASCLQFDESGRLDAPYAQKGVVSIPNKSGHIYLHTNEEGQMRLGVFGRPLITGEMYGLLTTLQAGRGAQLLPVAAPIALLPMAQTKTASLGRISAKDAAYPEYRAHLHRILADGHARILGS